MLGSEEAEEVWKNKVELDAKVAGRGSQIIPNSGVMPDIQPYKSMIDGSIINSRSTHRDHLRSHGCVEVGNETKYVTAAPPKKEVDWKPEIIKQIHHAKEQARR